MISLHTQFNEALAKLKKTSVFKFNEVFDECQKLTTIEEKLNAVNAALGIKESASRTGKMELFTETDPHPLRKHNGASDNGHGTTETESNRTGFWVGSSGKTGDDILREALGIPEEKMPEGLSDRQRAEYGFARSIGISEADALKLVNVPLVEANRRF